MTVRELIAHLSTLPQEYEVAYRSCSDSAEMEASDICVISAEEKKVVRHHNMNDRMRDYREYEHKNGPPPEFISVVMFPGN